MLRSKDGSSVIERQRIGGVLAAALIALVGASTVALPGAAEPADALPPVSAASAFDAKPLDLSFMGPVDLGLVVVRPSELSRRQGFAPLGNLVQMFVQDQFDEMMRGGVKAPQVRFDKIDYIALEYSQRLAGEKVFTEAGAAPNAPIHSTMALRYADPFDAHGWLLANMPGVEAVETGGITYLRGDWDASSGASLYFAQRDARTIVLSSDEERLRQLVSGAEPPGDRDADAWAAIGGSVAAFMIKPPQYPGGLHEVPELVRMVLGIGVAEGQPDPITMAARDILNGSETIVVGLDLGSAPNRILFYTSFFCADAATAQRVRDGVDVFRQFAKVMSDHFTAQLAADPGLMESLKDVDEASRALSETYLLATRLLADATLELRPQDDGPVDVWFEMTGELPASVLTAMAGIEDAAIRTPALAPADGAIQR